VLNISLVTKSHNNNQQTTEKAERAIEWNQRQSQSHEGPVCRPGVTFEYGDEVNVGLDRRLGKDWHGEER
jgi:hypothetical protein